MTMVKGIDQKEIQQQTTEDNSLTHWACKKGSLMSRTFVHLVTQTPKNLTHYAGPIILMGVMAAFQGAQAGPLAYAGCCALCAPIATAGTVGVAPMAVAACLKLCLPLYFAPTP